jgi:hypothetical protein
MPFQGQVFPIAAGTSGYNANANLITLLPEELIQALNITYEFGTIQREGGSAIYNVTPLGNPIPPVDPLAGDPLAGFGFGGEEYTPFTIVGGHDWFPYLDTTQRSIIVCGNRAIRKDTQGQGTYPTALTILQNQPSNTPVFVEGGREEAANPRKLFIYTGTNNIQVLASDGTTTTNLANPPSDFTSGAYPLGGTIHLGSHIAFGGINPHWIYMSDPTNHENFTASDPNVFYLPVYPGVGQYIAALVSFQGMLIVFKYPRGIFYINMLTAGITNWFTVQVSLEVGIAGPNAWAYRDDDVVFMDCTGSIHSLLAIINFGFYGIKSLSDQKWIRNFIVNNVNQVMIPSVQTVYYLFKREVHFLLTKFGNTLGGIRLVMDVNNPQMNRFRYSDKDNLTCMWLTRNEALISVPWGADPDGTIWEMDQPNKSVNGYGYNSVFQTAFVDFSTILPVLGSKRKNFKFLELVGDTEGNWSILADVYIDANYVYTTLFTMGVLATGLGSIVLGQSALSGGGAPTSCRRRLIGSGKRISATFSLFGSNEDFSLSSLIYSFTVAGESDDH